VVKLIVIQKGHNLPLQFPESGATGATGEATTTDALGDAIKRRLEKDSRFNVRIIPSRVPADLNGPGAKGDAFISLHCDGSSDPKRDGWGIGGPGSVKQKPVGVNGRLAELVRAQIAKFHRSEFIDWNYTVNMSEYYAWSRVDISGPEILVEHGFSSNPKERAWMLENKGKFAEAYYIALCKFFGFVPRSADPLPEFRLVLTDGEGKDLVRGAKFRRRTAATVERRYDELTKAARAAAVKELLADRDTLLALRRVGP
jgi:N-acetylmuramoyl-L-alanine amidase